jgi:hypothetical protein
MLIRIKILYDVQSLWWGVLLSIDCRRFKVNNEAASNQQKSIIAKLFENLKRNKAFEALYLNKNKP